MFKQIYIIAALVFFAPFIFILVLFGLKNVFKIDSYPTKVVVITIGISLLLLWLVYDLMDKFVLGNVC